MAARKRMTVEERRERLRRYATWTEEEAQELEEVLRTQRAVEDEL